jgi:bacteriocin biosynthesis cyclodehydratase domain-containing protein
MATGSRPLPALHPGVAVIPMDGGVELRMGDEEVHVLRTDAPDLILRVLEQLDGRHDRNALVASIGPGGEPLLDELLGELARAGMIGSPVEELDKALSGARVAVVGHAPAAELMARVLVEHGIEAAVRERGAAYRLGSASAGAVVCLCEQPDLALLFEVNDAACDAKLPCLFVDLSHGRHATVGPFYVPGDGACYRCLRARLHENTAAYAELLAAERQMLDSGRPLPAFGCLPAHRHLCAGVAAGEIVAFFAKHRPLRTLNRAVTVALEHARMWSEPVFRVPWCDGCAGTRDRSR